MPALFPNKKIITKMIDYNISQIKRGLEQLFGSLCVNEISPNINECYGCFNVEDIPYLKRIWKKQEAIDLQLQNSPIHLLEYMLLCPIFRDMYNIARNYSETVELTLKTEVVHDEKKNQKIFTNEVEFRVFDFIFDGANDDEETSTSKEIEETQLDLLSDIEEWQNLYNQLAVYYTYSNVEIMPAVYIPSNEKNNSFFTAKVVERNIIYF